MKMTKQAFQLNVGILVNHAKNKLSEEFASNVFRAHSKLILELIGENADLKKRVKALEEALDKKD